MNYEITTATTLWYIRRQQLMKYYKITWNTAFYPYLLLWTRGGQAYALLSFSTSVLRSHLPPSSHADPPFAHSIVGLPFDEKSYLMLFWNKKEKLYNDWVKVRIYFQVYFKLWTIFAPSPVLRNLPTLLMKLLNYQLIEFFIIFFSLTQLPIRWY